MLGTRFIYTEDCSLVQKLMVLILDCYRILFTVRFARIAYSIRADGLLSLLSNGYLLYPLSAY